MYRLKHLALIALVAGLTCPATADMQEAVAAYRDRDFERAFEAFSALAQEGEARAQTVLAIMYRYGEGVTASQREAYRWYRRAAEKGYAPAQYALGDMLMNGEGVAADVDAGMRWMRQAADAGHPRALAFLDVSGPVSTETGDALRWSRQWDLRLPNAIRFDPPVSAPAFRVQLGEGSSVGQLQALWQARLAHFPDVLERLAPSYLRDLTADMMVYQLQAGSFGTEAEARALCEALSPSPCTVVYQ